MTKRILRAFRDGIPVDAKQWTEDDWRDLHEAIESVKFKVRARHSGAGAEPMPHDGACGEPRHSPQKPQGSRAASEAAKPSKAGRTGGSIPPTGDYQLVEQCEHGRPYDLHIVRVATGEIVGRYFKGSRESAERHLREWNEGKRA